MSEDLGNFLEGASGLLQPESSQPQPPDQIPLDKVVITRDGLVCKCGHEPMDHDDFTCTHPECDCPWSRQNLTPHPHKSTAAKILPDGRLATLYQELTGFKILIGPADDMTGGDEFVSYRYEDLGFGPPGKSSLNVMLTRFQDWDGYGYPPGWYRWRAEGDYVYNTEDGKQPRSDKMAEMAQTLDELAEEW